MSQLVYAPEHIKFKLECDIVVPMTNDLKIDLQKIIDDGANHIIIDMEKVEMIDSVGLGVLILIHNKLKQKGGRLSVQNLSDDIFALFRTMRLNQHFEVIAKK